MTEELTHLLIEKKRITRAALHLLLNAGNFHHLDLSKCPKLVTDQVVNLIAAKCKVGFIIDVSTALTLICSCHYCGKIVVT